MEEWFYVTPSNNTWNESKIDINLPYSGARRIRVMFALWDTYLDDISLTTDDTCWSTPRNRARNGKVIKKVVYESLIIAEP